MEFQDLDKQTNFFSLRFLKEKIISIGKMVYKRHHMKNESCEREEFDTDN